MMEIFLPDLNYHRLSRASPSDSRIYLMFLCLPLLIDLFLLSSLSILAWYPAPSGKGPRRHPVDRLGQSGVWCPARFDLGSAVRCSTTAGWWRRAASDGQTRTQRKVTSPSLIFLPHQKSPAAVDRAAYFSRPDDAYNTHPPIDCLLEHGPPSSSHQTTALFSLFINYCPHQLDLLTWSYKDSSRLWVVRALRWHRDLQKGVDHLTTTKPPRVCLYY